MQGPAPGRTPGVFPGLAAEAAAGAGAGRNPGARGGRVPSTGQAHARSARHGHLPAKQNKLLFTRFYGGKKGFSLVQIPIFRPRKDKNLFHQKPGFP